jgi:hypothetical protein
MPAWGMYDLPCFFYAFIVLSMLLIDILIILYSFGVVHVFLV